MTKKFIWLLSDKQKYNLKAAIVTNEGEINTMPSEVYDDNINLITNVAGEFIDKCNESGDPLCMVVPFIPDEPKIRSPYMFFTAHSDENRKKVMAFLKQNNPEFDRAHLYMIDSQDDPRFHWIEYAISHDIFKLE